MASESRLPTAYGQAGAVLMEIQKSQLSKLRLSSEQQRAQIRLAREIFREYWNRCLDHYGLKTDEESHCQQVDPQS